MCCAESVQSCNGEEVGAVGPRQPSEISVNLAEVYTPTSTLVQPVLVSFFTARV